jgi:RHS repeat-associated protein
VLTSLATVLAGGTAVFALPARPVTPPAPYAGPAVRTVAPLPSHFVAVDNPTARSAAPAAVHWPAAANVTLTVPSAAATVGASVATARASGAPVWVQPVGSSRGGLPGTSTVRVQMLDHAAATAAGIPGVMFTVAGSATGAVRIGIDDSAFADGYGGNYSSRLHLVTYPACILTTPSLPACRRGTPLNTRNDYAHHALSAQVTVHPTGAVAPQSAVEAGAVPTVGTVQPLVMVVMSAPAGGDGGSDLGSYSATTLKPEGSWSAGGSDGSFDYEYPIPVAPGPSGLVPTMGLSYTSAAADGTTASTQAQASWVGDGWSAPQNFIEQSFTPCSASPEGTASPVSTSDECYAGHILTISLNGSTTSLVWDAGNQIWKPQSDSGQIVRHVTGTNNGSGTYNTDEWVVTDRSGTTYTFGMNHLPGWVSPDAATNSVDYEPVYSSHPKETGNTAEPNDPCNNISGSGFANSVCTMAYRWNLDYVTDVHGNAMAYYYKQNTNKYGQDNGATVGTYVRESYLDHIDYGFTAANAYVTAPDRVAFLPGIRCVLTTGCGTLGAGTKANYPDVPYDLICTSTTSCPTWSPSFFSTVSLATISAQQYSLTASGYVDVDTYALTYTLPPMGDGTSPALWLSTITHTGNDTTSPGSAAITLPATTFVGTEYANRVDHTVDSLDAYYRYRITSIITQTGSVIGVTYTLPHPCTPPVTITPSSNTYSCYPVLWTPTGYPQITDWFEKYAVSQVKQTDPTGAAPDQIEAYSYGNNLAAWHYDDNEVVQKKYRTYGQFRGYGDVTTYTGDGGNDRRTKTETLYYRGMSTAAAPVSLTDSQSGTHDDADPLAGHALESTVYRGEGGQVESSTITSYWISAATATRQRTPDLPDLTANWVVPIETFDRQAYSATGSPIYHYAESDYTVDATPTSPTFGLALHTYVHTVPATAATDACTSNTYAAPNTTLNIVGLVAESEQDSVACGGFTEPASHSAPTSAEMNKLTAPTAVVRPDNVISDLRTFYDDPTFSTTFPQTAAPTKGDITMTMPANGYNGSAFTYQYGHRSTYDSVGRVVATYSPNVTSAVSANATTTTYTTNSLGLITGMSVKNPLQPASSAVFDTKRGVRVSSQDANGITSNTYYDSLGRVVAAWGNSRPVSSPANVKYTYLLSSTGITATTTQTLDDAGGTSDYITDTTLYDAMLRTRQTQSQSPAGGRVVSDTFYDSRGWTSHTFNSWWDPATNPNTTLVTPSQLTPVAHVYNEDFYTYNGLGEQIVDTSEQDGVVQSTTTAFSNGDQSTTIPPTGGVIQTSKTDPMGRLTELDNYTASPTVTSPSDTFTGYYTITPVSGHTQATSYQYDGHGNGNTVIQGLPGTGAPTWSTTYNLLGQSLTQTDPDAGSTPSGSPNVYDADGNLTQVTNAHGDTVSFTYDALDRKTAEYAAPTGSQTASNELDSWVYDNSNNVAGVTNPYGHLTTATAYWGTAPNNAYTEQEKAFNVFGESTGETVTIPTTEGFPVSSYTFTHTYTTTLGLDAHDVYTAAGGLPAETVVHNYTPIFDQPASIAAGSTFATATSYDAWGRPTREQIGSATPDYVNNTYDQHTGALKDVNVTHVTGGASIDEHSYNYDAAGNILNETDTRNGSTATSETQCYAYDTLDQLATAWTATDNCTPPTTTNHAGVGDNLGTSSAYWTTWTVDNLGDRSQQVQHAFTGGPASDTTTTYCYGASGGTQPHTLTATSTTGCATPNTTYTYDTSGNMATRNAGQGNQTFTYNNAGQLTAVTGGTGGNTTYKYDANGQLLVQTDPAGTTLYLPSEQLTLVGSVVTGTRYYALPGGGTVVRTGTVNNYTYELTDQHGTPSLYLDYTAQTPTWRQSTPYGAPRGAAATSPDNHGFLNKPTDTNTGLTTIGARQYDPATGRFTTDDPILEATSPGQLNGYSYTANNPNTQSDPTGLSISAATEGGGSRDCGFSCQYDAILTPDQKVGAVSVCNFAIDTVAGIGSLINDTSKANNGWHINPSSITNWATSTKSSVDSFFGIYPGTVEMTEANVGEVGINVLLVAVPFCDAADAAAAADGNLITKIIAGVKRLVGADGGDIGGVKGPTEPPTPDPPTTTDTVDPTGTDTTPPTGTDTTPPTGTDTTPPTGTDTDPAGTTTPSGGDTPCESFTATTRVLMADGTSKAIKDVHIGDHVLANDTTTGTNVNEPVTDTDSRTDTDLADVTVKTAAGTTSTIHTTSMHPFWSDDRRTWIYAGQLHHAERLHGPHGDPVTVVSVKQWIHPQTMLDLTVNTVHSFYVLAGTQPVLVHNCGGATCNCASEGYPSYDKPGGWLTAMGPARDYAQSGETLNWEHVVEQSQAAKSGFPLEWINHPDNMMLLDSTTNFAKNGYYAKTFNWTGGQSIRRMLVGMPFEQQWDFGMYVINTIKTYGKQGLPGNV